MSLFHTPQLRMLGQLAVYALVGCRTGHQPFGAVTLASGDEVDWVDMQCQAIPAPEKQ